MKIRDDAADARMARTPNVLVYLPWILRYPLSGHCLPVLVMLTLFSALALRSSMVLPPPLPDTGLPLLVITAMWTLFYLMRVIEHSSQGFATPPPMDGNVLFLSPLKLFRILLLPMLYVNLAVWLPQNGFAAALPLAGVLAACTVPVYWLILATDDDLGAALNPLRGMAVVFTLGPAYFVACALLSGMVLVVTHFWGALATPLLLFGAVYGLYATCHLLGYLAYHQHQTLGIDVRVRDPDVVERERAQADQLERLMQRLHGLLLRGDEAGAVRELRAEPDGPLDAVKFLEDLFPRVTTLGKPILMLTVGQRLVSAQLAIQRDARALDVAERCLEKAKTFAPLQPAQGERLGRAALAGGHLGLFKRLERELAEAYPNDPVLTSLRFAHAQHLASQLNDDAGALALLTPLLAHSQHPLHGRIAALHKALSSLAQRKIS